MLHWRIVFGGLQFVSIGFQPFLFTPVLFFLFCASKEKEKYEKKEKIAVVFYALTGIWADLAFASKAGPASRFSYARYGCLRTTLAVCALSYLACALFLSCKFRAFPLHGGGLGWGLVFLCLFESQIALLSLLLPPM